MIGERGRKEGKMEGKRGDGWKGMEEEGKGGK